MARIDPAARAAPIVQEEVVSIGPAVEADPVIWTARLRTGRVVILRASGSRAFRAAALIALAAVGVDLAAVIGSAVEDSVAAVIAFAVAVAVAGSGADAEN